MLLCLCCWWWFLVQNGLGRQKIHVPSAKLAFLTVTFIAKGTAMMVLLAIRIRWCRMRFPFDSLLLAISAISRKSRVLHGFGFAIKWRGGYLFSLTNNKKGKTDTTCNDNGNKQVPFCLSSCLQVVWPLVELWAQSWAALAAIQTCYSTIPCLSVGQWVPDTDNLWQHWLWLH